MEAVFLKILNMSFSAALVIVVVIVARLLLRRAPKKWSYLLWCVVAFRLLCPVSFSAPFSVLRLTAQPAVVTQSASSAASEIAYIPQDIGLMAQPRVYVGTPRVSEAVSDSLPAPQALASVNPLQVWTAVGTVLWCAGMAVLLLYGVISYVNLRRRLRGAVRTEDGVFETDAVRAPFILGLFYPTIYLPPGLEGEPLRYVLAHERFHLRRGDHAVKLLAFVLLTVHWFNPLVWLAFALMSRDMEMRCDEAVLSAERGITKPYSMALLSFATERRFPSPSPLCFGETGVKERIRNVLRWKKPRAWVTVCAAALCVIAVAACAVNPSKKAEPTGTPWDWTSTVTAAAIKSVEGNGLTLDAEQTRRLVEVLNAVKPEEVVRGRGIPSVNVLDITTGVGYRLRWGGGVIELDFDDNAAAAELYGSPDTLGPGVWEIHNDALYAFLDGLEAAPAPASASDLDGADTLDWGPNLSPDGHMYVRRYQVRDCWEIYIPVSGWTLEEASEARTKWTSDAGTGSTLVVRRASAEEYAAERPELADGQAEKWVPAGDGGYWLVFTQYDPMLLIRSSWVGAEPGLLQRMAESFALAGGGAAPVEESMFDKKLRDVPEPIYIEVSASGAPRVVLSEDEIRTLWDMYSGLAIVSESRKLPADWEEWGDALWVVQFWDDPGQIPCGTAWHIHPDDRVYVYRSTEAQVYAACAAGSIDYEAIRAIYENRRIIERSPEDIAAAFTAARAWCSERGITLQTLWYDPVDASDWTIFRIARDRFTRGTDADERNEIELYCEGTWPESATAVTGVHTISMMRLHRERGDLPWMVIDHGNDWPTSAYDRETRDADRIVYG